MEEIRLLLMHESRLIRQRFNGLVTQSRDRRPLRIIECESREMILDFKNHHFELIIVSLEFPILDIGQMLEQIQLQWPHTPVAIFINHDDQKPKAVQMMRMGTLGIWTAAEIELKTIYQRHEEMQAMLDYRLECKKRVAVSSGEINQLKQKNKALTQLAFADPLTGLMNKRYMERTLQREFELARQKKQEFCLAKVNINRLRSVNSRYGHIIGDKMIELAASSIKAVLGEKGIPIRKGGGEFYAYLHCAKEECENLMQNLRNEIAKLKLSWNQYTVPLEAATSCVHMDDALHRGEEMIFIVDKKMEDQYKALHA